MIGSVADVARPQETPVEGYGLVAGLSGTGSAICPPAVRAYLRQYILAQIPDVVSNIDELINSPNTAVVQLEGRIPAAAMKGDRFDVRVNPVVGSDTISLRGGRLYLAELKLPGMFGVDARTFATVEGPVFTDLLGPGEPSLKTGYILGGGRASYDYVGVIHLRRADFMTASTIRNRLNERYGPDVATAVSQADVGYKFPPEYRLRKERFIRLLDVTYLTVTTDLTAARIDAALRGLADANDKETSEITLEALGRESLAGLAPLLKSSNQETRFRAARCMLYLHDDRAVETLYAMVADRQSPYRLEALEAIALGARRDDAGAIAGRCLNDEDGRIVQAAFEHLRRLGDPVVREEIVNHDFYLDQVTQTRQKAIFVSRSGEPRIVLFGASLNCRDGVSIESPDGWVVISGRPGDNSVSLIRKYPPRKPPLPPARSSLMASDIIRTLGADPAGLGVSYTEITVLLERMCAGQAIEAQFWPGPPPKFQQTVKK